MGRTFIKFSFWVAVVAIFAINTEAQRTKQAVFNILLEPAAAYDLDQCRNGAVEDGTNPDCVFTGTGASGWVNGNAGNSNAHWAEAQFISYRARLSGLAPGTHTIVLEYDVKEGGRYAIDYLGGYNVTETDADACSGAGCAGAGTPFTIPVDPVIAAQINPLTGNPITIAPVADRQMLIWGGTITNITYNGTLDLTQNAPKRSISVTFTSTDANPVLAWGGHIAWRGDWGLGNSAASINGSSYHMRILSLDGSGGNQDRSLMAGAVDLSGGILIEKKVETPDNTDTSTQAFTFTSTAYFPNPADPQNQFQLIDNVPGAGGETRESAAIFDTGGTTTVFVTESATPSWTLLSVDCDDLDSTQNSIDPTATINVTGGEIVRCTFVNGLQNASAADATVSGRVTDSFGRAISSAKLTLINGTTGESTSVYTNSFGFYKFDGLPVGDFFVMNVQHRRYLFVNGSVSFSLEDNIAGLDFQASR